MLNSERDKHRLLIENLKSAYAYHRLVKNNRGEPVDYIFLEVNQAFSEMTGLAENNIIGKRVTEVLPGIETSRFNWIAFYGDVVLSGKTVYFKQYFEPLDRHYDVTAYRVDDQHFSTIFHDVTDRKEKESKEKSARRSERLAQNVLDAMNANICVLDRHGYILVVNKSWLDFAKSNNGRIEAVSPGVNYLDVCDRVEGEERETAKEFASGIRELVEGKRDYFQLEYSCDAPTTKRRYLGEATSFFDMSLDSLLIVITHTDITEYKQNESLLQARLDLLEFSSSHDLDAVLQRTLDETCTLVDSPIGFYHFVSPDQKKITLHAWSTATLEQYCAMGSLSGKSYSIAEAGIWADSIQEKQPVIHNDYYSLPHRKGLPEGHVEIVRELVVPIIRRDKVVAILGVGNKGTGYNDRDISIVNFFADLAWTIVEKKQAEVNLAESEEKHRRLFETMAQGVIYQAADSTIISANPAAEIILGLSFEQMQGKTSMDPHWQMIEEDGTTVPGTDHPAMIALRTGQKVGPVTRGVFNPDKNRHIWLSITAIPLFQPGETEPFQVYATFIDITERKQSEEALHESRSKIQDILSNIPDNGAVFQFIQKADGSYDIPFMSDSAVCIFERPIETIQSTAGLFEEVPEDDLPGLWNSIKQSAQDMTPWKYDFRITTKISGQKWIRGFSNPRRLNDGSICWTGMILDITAQKQAEEALVEKQQFDKLQNEVAEAFFSFYEEGPGEALNNALQRTCKYFSADRSFLFELSPGGEKMINTFQWCNRDKVGLKDPSRNHPLQIEDFSWGHEQIKRYGYIHVPDVELMPPEAGSEKQEFLSLQLKSIIAVPLIVQDALYGFLAYSTVNEVTHWSKAQITNIRAIGEKITPVILRQRFLKQKEEAYDKALTVLDSIDALIYVADLDTYDVLYVNRYGLEAWGDIQGRKCWEALQKNQTGPCDFCTNHILLDKNGQSTGIHKWQNKNTLTGQWYEISDQAIYWIDGTMKRLSVALNITELKAVEQQLEEARGQAEEANRAKSKFLATMSHEIRTPMNVIIGMTDLLCGSGLEEPYHEYACMANDSADHLLGIIDDILDFSKIEADQLEVMPSRIKLTREVVNTILAFKNQAAKKDVELLYLFAEHLPEEVILDPARLKQVLINLIGNAVKFTEKGKVEITVSLAGGDDTGKGNASNRSEVLFVVKDTGPGIDKKDQEHLFKSFSQLDQLGQRVSEGTGLGLAISKKLVELMGGRIWLESEPGKGSAFYFTLPYSLPEEFSAEEIPSGKDNILVKQEKINLNLLLAEDKPMNQKLAKVFLEQMGHRVVLAANGKEAVDAVKKHRYDAVLMDINMPEMDGLEATKNIRAWEKKSGLERTAIIAMTAYAMKGDREKFLKAGLDDYISKPINKEVLKEAMQRVELTRST